MNNINVSSLGLAYIGDSVYELKIREFLINKKIAKINDLQKQSLNYVTAKKQAYFLDTLLKNDFFTEKEVDIIKTARNTKTHSKPKNCDILTYKHATALEAIIGYLYLDDNEERINEIMDKILNL